ncbi:MAG: anti-sigma factor [Candidatus Binatia bacterium]
MNTQAACPDLPLLSQFYDHELSVAEEETLRQHVATCVACQARIAQLLHATDQGRTALAYSSGFSTVGQRTALCLSPETVTAYVHRLLPTASQRRAEQHLHTCLICFNEIEAARQTASSLAAPTLRPVPAALKAQAATLWQQTTATTPTPSLSRVVVQLADKGLQLIEQHLVAPFLHLQEVLVPSPAYRSEEVPQQLNFTLTAGQYTLAVTIVPDGHGIALTLVLLGSQQEGVAGHRMFLSQHGRSVLSRKTDQHGSVKVPHLEPGLYEIACAGIDGTFEVELRA